MFRVQIEGFCSESVVLRFQTYEDAKRCFYSALYFVFPTHPDESVEVLLLNDGDYLIMSAIVERDMLKE